MNTAHRYRALGVLAAVALAGTGLTACSSGTTTETEQARALLVADVARVQHAVAAHEASRARRAVARLESDVHRLEMSGELSSTAAHAVLAAAVRVR
ncbi:MAG TPA: hypothetical protein VKU92_04360, partial [Acidimicrobiales bacterium]|nr:hypothetical protein [Acidimicrobiales bacterium]